jgi:hypothetical protein
MLQARSRSGVGRAWLTALFERFAGDAGPEGRIRETFDLIYLTGWAPDPTQPKPARRGSATASMVDALRVKPA